LGEEAIKGSITTVADYVVLADDPHTVDVEKIKDIEIVRTVVSGSTSASSSSSSSPLAAASCAIFASFPSSGAGPCRTRRSRHRARKVKALMFLAAIALTFTISCVVERSRPVQDALSARLCPTGWRLEMVGENPVPYCKAPVGQVDRCQLFMLVELAPVLICVAVFAAEFIWLLARRPAPPTANPQD
jgi:hypothetical protein